MKRKTVAGGWYADSLTTGEWVSLIPSQRLETHRGVMALPLGDEPLYHRITAVGGFKIGGQGHNTASTWLWDGDWAAFGQACGTSPVIFDNAGLLNISHCGPIGSQGWRYVAPDGSLVTGDATYGPRHGLTEYTDLSDAQDGSLMVGQGHDVGGVCVWDGTLRRLAEGSCFTVRARRDGDAVSIAFYDVVPGGTNSQFVWATVAELHALPPAVVVPPIVIPPVEPPHPTEPPVSIPNQIAIVRAVRAKYPTPLGARHAACLMELALAIGQTAGLLRKTGGTTITLPDGTTVAQDIICFPNGDAYDVLGDGEGASTPTWDTAGGSPLDPARYYAVTGAVPPVVVPPDVPPVVPPVDVSAIVAQLAALNASHAALIVAVGQLDGRVQELIDRPAPAVVFPPYSGALGLRLRLLPEKA